MIAAPRPISDAARVAALHSYNLLDTQADQTLDDLVRLAGRLTRSPISLVSLLDHDRQWFQAKIGLEASETPRELAFCGHAILAPDEVTVVPDATRDPRFRGNPLVTGAPGIRFYAGAPLVNPEGHALGTLCVIDTQPRIMPREDRETLAILARAVMTTMELRRTAERAQSMAIHDALTGLPNRAAFFDSLARALALQQRTSRPLALLCLDLDGFKGVNDVLGHAEGDRVLRCVAETLRRTLRAEDIPARLGGDEFAVLLEGGEGVIARAVGERLCRAVKAAMDARGWPVTVSIGAATLVVQAKDPEQALAIADELLYAAKHAGRNCVVHRVVGMPRAV